MKFFDINCYAGTSNTGTYKPAESDEELIEEMDSAGINKALVWHIAQCKSPPGVGNGFINRIIKDRNRLLGTWTALPPQADEQQEPDIFFEKMKENKICALRLFPNEHRFLLKRTVFGGFMDQIAEKKIPVLFSIERGDINWQGIYDILEEYPQLVCIICDTGIWGTDRYFRPLVETYENVYLDTSLLALGDGVTESFVNDYGPSRLLFGTGFPERIPEAPMLQLLQADIKDEQKEQIAYKNSEKLISEVQL